MVRILLLLLTSCSLFASPPKAVVFDYGGVVAKVDRKPTLLFISESTGKPYRKVKKKFSGERLYHAFNQPRSFWEEYAGKKLPESWHKQLDGHKENMVKAIPGMRELILGIKSQGIQVALLSNTNVHRARFLESMGGYDPFDPILLSCHLGVRKPDPKIYQSLLKSLIWDAKDLVFIDNQSANVIAAKEFGIDGITFQSVEQIKSELRKREILLVD